MDYATAQGLRESSSDMIAELNDRLERKQSAIEERIKGDRELRLDAVDCYLDDHRIGGDGHDLLLSFLPALADSEKFMDAIAHGDPLPDSELPAFRALLQQIETARRHMDVAIEEAVTAEMCR